MTTMIFDLPRDIVEDILSRLPMKSMRAVRLTCKKWNTLSKSRSFSKMRIDKEKTKEGESQMMVMVNEKLYLMNIVINGDPYIELQRKLTCVTLGLLEQLKVFQIFNCEGLLLCILQEDQNIRLMVWNPYCMQPKWFELRCSYNRMNYLYHYGLGYVEKIRNKSCGRSHKILRFMDLRFFQEEGLFGYEIYDFESGSWRTLDITPLWSIRFYGFGITVKGNTYWCVSEKNAEGFQFHIISFDFTKERFGPLMLLPYNGKVYYYVVLSCVKDEKLAALLQHNQHHFEIWITSEVEAEKVSWSKFLTLRPGIAFTYGSFIIDEEKKVAIHFDGCDIIIFGEDGDFKKLNIRESADIRTCKRHMCVYVPSLMQIK